MLARSAHRVNRISPSGVPGWQTIPSWSLIGTADHVIPTDVFHVPAGARSYHQIDAGRLS
jgi:hypothetical protein